MTQAPRHLLRHWSASLRVFIALLVMCMSLPALALEFDQHPGDLGSAKGDIALFQEAFPGTDRVEPVADLPWPVNALYRGDELVGYAFESAEVAPIPAYSGRPVDLLIAIDPSASLRLAKVLNHSEPIMLVGVPSERLDDFAGQHLGDVAPGSGRRH